MLVDPNYIGRNGIYSFTGVVEDINDPLQVGRVRVRCFGLHSESLTDMPTEDLPWFYVGTPTTSASISQVGQSVGLVEGSTVWGIFLDGYDTQEGVVISSFPAIPLKFSDGKAYSNRRKDFSLYPKQVVSVSFDDGKFQEVSQADLTPYPLYIDEPDTSRLSRGIGDVVVSNKNASRNSDQIGIPISFEGTWDEPGSAFGSVYPYNRVNQTESGHVVELDDTPGSERVHIYHRTGSFVEYRPDGSTVFKSVNNRYDIVHANSYEHVEQDKIITIDQGLKLLVNKDELSDGIDIEVLSNAPINVTVRRGDVNLTLDEGNLNFYVNGNVVGEVTQNINLSVGGDVTSDVTGNVTETVGGSVNTSIGGSLTANVSGNTILTTPTLTVNGNVNVNGSIAVTNGLTTPADVVAGGISLITHVHGGVTPGGATTSPPM